MITVQEWLQKPRRKVPFGITRKTELTDNLAADLEICCLGIIHFLQHWNKELQGEGFSIKQVDSEPNPIIFNYKGYNFNTYWLNPDQIGVAVEGEIL